MSTTATFTVPLNKLVAWKGNVRKTDSDIGIKELAASIAAHGLLQSLVVTEVNDKFEVVAGRRRLMALNALVKVGKIKATYDVGCQIVGNDADLTEISLTENVVREPMHPADEFETFNALIKKGSPIADVAARFGVTETVVEKRLKMANVSPVIIKAYRNGDMTLQHVMAFAVTSDHEKQEKVWADMPKYMREDPDDIRANLIDDEITAKDRRVKFITLKAYEKAGGVVERDLFSTDDDGVFIKDRLLLSNLVAAKLEKIAEGVRKEGWKWVEVREEFNHSEWNRCAQEHEKTAALSPKKQAELDALNKQYEKLSNADDGEDENPALDAVMAKIDKLESGPRSWQPEQLAIAGAVVAIGYNGKSQIERGYVKPEDKPKPTKTVQKKAEDGSVTEEQVEQAFTLSAPLIESLTTQRTAALAAVMQGKPQIGLVALVHSLALQVVYDGSMHDSCLKVHIHQTYPQDIEGSKAHKVMEAADAKWKKTVPSNEDALWGWLLKQKQPVLIELLAYCAAKSIDAIERKHEKLAGREQSANDIAKAIGLDMSEWSKPGAENYFGRISKPGILEALNEAKVEITPAMDKSKKSELATVAEREIGKTNWLPSLLRAPTL